MSFCSDGTGGLRSEEEAAFKVLYDDVKGEWKLLWHDRIDDRVRAEGVASRDYSLLFVECGTVIVASRGFKPVDFKEILSLHRIQNLERNVPSDSSVGGMGKFARTILNKQKRYREWKEPVTRQNRKQSLQQPKQGGRGWLHSQMKK